MAVYHFTYISAISLALAEKPGYVLHLCGSHLVLGGPMLPRILSIKLQPTSRANLGDGCQWIRFLCLQHTLQEVVPVFLHTQQ